MSVNVAVTAAQHARDWVDYWTLGSAVAGVIVLGSYTYYAKKQRDEAKRSADAATQSANAAMISAKTTKRALETLERADVLIEVVMVSSMKIRDDTEVTVVLKNYGRTRATNVSCVCTIAVLELHQGPLPIHAEVTPMIIGVGASCDVRFMPIGDWLDANTIEWINAGHLPLQLTVEISYSNVFDSARVHRATCDGVFRPDSGAFPMRQIEAEQ